MNIPPKVSIIMGIYNCSETLDEAIESLINQTYTNWEIVMCDDGSTDDTVNIAEKYCALYPNKIKILYNEKNMGLNYTLNRCLNVAEGDYIARMDGDDISLPDRLQKEVDFLEHNKEFAIVSTPMIFFDSKGDWGRCRVIEVPQISDFIFHAPFHCHAPFMIRREAYLTVGGYTVDKKYLRYEDCNLWYKLYAKGYRGYNLQIPLYKMRDDRNAYHRRTKSSRIRSVYVQFMGFKMIGMPLKFYPFLAVEFVKSLFIAFLPEKIYMILHKKKQNN